ncbi:ABC transporter permease [Natrarchaeobius halalkaliphilus]|uniref:ABC transporter permease n=1 Tax=Natrarchaeobius halalkaliphilus TaxID=1679091 RepID=A0A3N6M017_9EURY|nr:ABC transporter permease [Natrarchaeobius halalkaliphilus]RQG87854.1 ABC transporter permease [Natrarchaeobius halalkaliphilus]
MGVNFDKDDFMQFTKSIYSLVIVLILWEVLAQMGLVYYYHLPPLSDVLIEFLELMMTGELIYHSYLTLRRALIGLVIGAIFGITIGILISRNSVVEWFFDPIIKIGYPIPIIALIPVFMLWFGIGDTSKIIMVAIGTFWPIAVNARNSAKQIDKNYIWSARMMGTTDRQLLWRVVLPAASPGIVTGLQIALPLSLIITFVFEMVAGGGGLGALEIDGVRTFNPTQVYAIIIAIMIIGMALDRLLRIGRKHYLQWS